jgi:sortase B
MSKKQNISTRIAAAMAAILILVSVMGFLYIYDMQNKANSTPPSPNMTTEEQAEASEDNDGFPVVDWDYWQSINPDIIGWITIPGTNIDSPIVHAPASDPNFYLSHDIYKNYNIYGAIYLDADSNADIFSNANSLVYGHHMSDGSMFTSIANYNDATWATEHAVILIQTPTQREMLTFIFSNIINANTETAPTKFETQEAYESWVTDCFNKTTITLNEPNPNQPTITLCTCSYTTYKNERILAHFKFQN